MYAVLGSNPLIGKKIFSAGQSPRGAAEGGDSSAELRGGVRGILHSNPSSLQFGVLKESGTQLGTSL